MTEMIKKMLEEHKGEPKYLQSHLINGYVALYKQIKLQMKHADSISNEVERIKNES